MNRPVRLSLPLDSLALVGAGGQGSALLSTFGMRSAISDAEFEALLVAGEASQDLAVAGSAAVCALSRRAAGWVTITDVARSELAAIAMPCDESILIAVFASDCVEWLVVPIADSGDVLEHLGLVDRAVQLTAFIDGVARGSYRCQGSSVDAAARDEDALARLSGDGATGDTAISRLFAEMTQTHMSGQSQ